ncbi:MAG: type IX secretion system sortase PorU, partial [Saprospiraceae bacterium]
LTLTVVFAKPPTTINKTLAWQKEITVQLAEDSEPVTIWRFEDAVYDERHPSLPWFSQRYKLDGYSQVSASFSAIGFEAFEKKATPDDAVLSPEIPINISLEKDRQDYYVHVSFIPIRKSAGGQYERLLSFELRLSYTPLPEPVTVRGGHTFTSVLNDGDIYKFAVTETGVHKLDFDFLKTQLGIPVENIDPRTLKIYGNGGGVLPELVAAERADDLLENAIEVVGEDDGKFDPGDYILFYAEGPERHYYDPGKQTFSLPKNYYDTRNYYFIKISAGNGLRIQEQPSLPGSTYTSNSFNDFIRYEKDISNLLHEWSHGEGSGQQWVGDFYKITTSRTYDDEFRVDNLIGSATAKLMAVFAGRIETGSSGRYAITANGTTFTSSNFSTTRGGSTDSYASVQIISGEFVPNDSQLKIELNFTKGSSSFNEGWLDYIEVNFRRQLLLSGSQMTFRDVNTIGHPVSTFEIGNASASTVVWDISNPLAPRRQSGTLSGTTFSFSANTENLAEFIAFDPVTGLLTAQPVGKIENQNVHAVKDVDMAIIYHPDFKEDAERLAQHRSEFSHLDVALVDVEQLYNEFSSGRKDATAIRDFAKMVLDRSPEKFKSMLLFGDGSFDSRDIYKLGGDFIPVYETAHSTSPIYAFPSDDYFALLSDNEGGNINFGALDIGVGRLPVKDAAEARDVVDKIIHYDTTPASLRDWRNRITFVADDEDNNLHIGDTDDIAEYIANKNPNLNVDKIYLDAFPQVSTPGGTRVPLANEALNNNIFKGTLAMIYLGHGGTKGWTQERILQIEDIIAWQNFDKMPLIITATCSFTAYDNPAFTSAGELSFLNKKGGAIGLFTTVRPVFASANERLTRQSMDTLFNKLNNERPRLGEVLRIGKNKTGDQSNSRKYLLIGDPAQQLALPNYNVTTTKINGHDISNGIIDTIRALQKVTIEGQIHDDFGNLMTDFNGVVYPTIFDKKIKYRTLSQDAGSPPFDFNLQKNVIFKGRASVSAGKFQYTFVVPKDIDYNFGKGKISYYAADESQYDDASGNYYNVIVGGTDPAALADSHGPQVEVFMNDENFVFGGITGKDPVLLVKLEDDNGINVVGNSIGHDLAGIMDKNSQNTYKLNDFYEAALDDYTKGEVRYPLYNLAEGRHEIKVTAWDIANNPAEGFTEFLVVTSEEMALRHVLNYPNPFTTSTCFMFEHNQSIGVEMDVLVQIYTVSGRLIKTLEERIISEGSRLGNDNCIRWDGRDDYGDPLGKGVYLYKVKVRSANTGDTVLKGESEFEKLVILK